MIPTLLGRSDLVGIENTRHQDRPELILIKLQKLIWQDNLTVKNMTVETEDPEQEHNNPIAGNPTFEIEKP